MRLQITVSLNTNAGARTEIRDLTNSTGINVSNYSELASTEKVKKFKGFQLSDNRDVILGRLDSGYKFFPSSGYSGYISREISNSTGSVSIEPMSFYLVGGANVMLSILFDPTGEGYAVNFDILNSSGQTIVEVRNNQRKEVNVNVPVNGTKRFSLKVLKWSEPYKSVIVSRLYVAQDIIFTGKDIESCEWSESSFDAQLNITPGIVEQYADIVLYDRDNKLHDYIANSATGEDSRHSLSINTLDESVGSLQDNYIITVWDAPGDSSRIKLTCTDLTSFFDKINVKSFPVGNRNVDDMLNFVFAQAGNLPWKYLDATIEQECKLIMTPNSWFRPCTLLQLLSKVCVLGLLRVYWSKNTFVVTRCW